MMRQPPSFRAKLPRLIRAHAADRPDSAPALPGDWASDGKSIVFRRIPPGTPGGLWAMTLSEPNKATAIPGTANRGVNGRVSPDGRWLAYQASPPGNASRSEVFVQPLLTNGPAIQVSRNQGGWPLWRSDGRELFFVSRPSADAEVMAVSVSGNSSSPFGAAVSLFKKSTLTGSSGISNANSYQYPVSRDGHKFLTTVLETETSPAITVMLNWPAALR